MEPCLDKIRRGSQGQHARSLSTLIAVEVTTSSLSPRVELLQTTIYLSNSGFFFFNILASKPKKLLIELSFYVVYYWMKHLRRVRHRRKQKKYSEYYINCYNIPTEESHILKQTTQKFLLPWFNKSLYLAQTLILRLSIKNGPFTRLSWVNIQEHLTDII